MSAALCALHAWLDTQGARVLVTTLAVVAGAWLALAHEARTVAPVVEPEISPLPSASASCRPRGKEALEHARSLERVAAARWERVPFALHEAPRAVAQLAEAEACFAAAQDRSGRTRVAATRRSYAAELERRFVRARLLLRAALRQDAAKRAWPAAFFRADGAARPATPRAPREASAVARQQLAILLALLDRASPSALPYRGELEQLARHYAAEPTPGAPHLPTILKPESTP